MGGRKEGAAASILRMVHSAHPCLSNKPFFLLERKPAPCFTARKCSITKLRSYPSARAFQSRKSTPSWEPVNNCLNQAPCLLSQDSKLFPPLCPLPRPQQHDWDNTVIKSGHPIHLESSISALKIAWQPGGSLCTRLKLKCALS